MASELPTSRSFSFPRSYRLKRRRLIRPLFDRSRKDVFSVTAGCVRLLFRVASRNEAGCNVPLQIGFATGRSIRNAVRRNQIKRLLRETYRVHQHLLIELFTRNPDHLLVVMVVFRGNPSSASIEIPVHLPRAFHRLADKIQEGSIPL